MQYPKLTPRLQMIADEIENEAVVADVGTDHAFLPVYLLQRGKIKQAIASDIRPGPLSSAKRTAEKYQVSENLSLRLGGGLETVKPEECDTIVIAGMGGENIRDILKAAPWTLAGKHTLFLQPMSMVQELRYFLLKNAYEIHKEYVCQEENHQYIILKCSGTGEKANSSVSFPQCIASPALLQAENGKSYLIKQEERLVKILDGLKQGQQVSAEQMQSIEETLRCLRRYLEEV